MGTGSRRSSNVQTARAHKPAGARWRRLEEAVPAVATKDNGGKVRVALCQLTPFFGACRRCGRRRRCAIACFVAHWAGEPAWQLLARPQSGPSQASFFLSRPPAKKFCASAGAPTEHSHYLVHFSSYLHNKPSCLCSLKPSRHPVLNASPNPRTNHGTSFCSVPLFAALGS